MPKGLLDELRPLLLSTDLELGGLDESPLWLDLVSSPMFVIASFLLVFGLMTTGVPLALIDGDAITARRTAGAAALGA